MGPLWYRGLITRGDGDEATVAPIPPGNGRPSSIDQEIDLVLDALWREADRGRPHAVARRDHFDVEGKLWRIDSAISRAYGGKPAYLEIVGDKVTAHEVPRPNAKAMGD